MAKDIKVGHLWMIRFYSGDELRYEHVPEEWSDVDDAWAYTSIYPYFTVDQVGEWRIESWLDIGPGFVLQKTKEFVVTTDGSGETPDPYDTPESFLCENIEHGSADPDAVNYNDLQAVGVKSVFDLGEWVQTLAKVKNIIYDHSWKVEIFNEYGSLTNTEESEWLEVGDNGWAYSSMSPKFSLDEGDYTVKFSLDIGVGYQDFGEEYAFRVRGEDPLPDPYDSPSSFVCESVDTNYDDLRPVNIKPVFDKDETVTVMAQVENIIYNHRWKIEVYPNGSNISSGSKTSAWQTVATTQRYANIFAGFSLSAESYIAKIWLDTGDGYALFAVKNFTVEDNSSFNSPTLFACANWAYGSTNPNSRDYWDLQAVGAADEFALGSKVVALAKAKDIKVGHRWMIKFYVGNELYYPYVSEWNSVVNATWAYTSVRPYITVEQVGNWRIEAWLDVGPGFVLQKTKSFKVSKDGPADEPEPPVEPVKSVVIAPWLLLLL